jgi:hypothetical protein
VTGLDEIEARLDDLIAAILPPMRATKYVDRHAFDALTNLLNDLIAEVGGSPDISRRLVGKLWFIFTQALTEAEHSRAPEEIMSYAWNYEQQLTKLFGPWFSSSETTPGIPRY